MNRSEEEGKDYCDCTIRDRQIIKLYLAGKDNKEIARISNITISTVKRKLKELKYAIAERYEQLSNSDTLNTKETLGLISNIASGYENEAKISDRLKALEMLAKYQDLINDKDTKEHKIKIEIVKNVERKVKHEEEDK